MRPIDRISFVLFGPTNLKEAETIESLLHALESDKKFIPEFASDDERRNKTYDREWCIRKSENADLFSENFIYIKRSHVAKYSGYYSVSKKPFMKIDFDAKLSEKHLSLIHISEPTRPY